MWSVTNHQYVRGWRHKRLPLLPCDFISFDFRFFIASVIKYMAFLEVLLGVWLLCSWVYVRRKSQLLMQVNLYAIRMLYQIVYKVARNIDETENWIIDYFLLVNTFVRLFYRRKEFLHFYLMFLASF